MSKTNDTSKLGRAPQVRELRDDELALVSGGDVLLSNVSKTRSEISMTFARNARA